MSRNVSAEFVEAVNAAETDEAFLVLLKLDGKELDDPIRLTSDSVDTSSRGNTYVHFPFKVELPKDNDDTGGTLARLKVDAVDRRVVNAARRVRGQPEVELEVVLASDPESVEISWPVFKLANARYGDTAIEGDLTLEVLDQEPFPSQNMNPGLFPGLF